MWEGQGWQRTRRQAGLFTFFIVVTLEAAFHVGLPIPVYTLIGGLLGLDLIQEAFGALRSAERHGDAKGKK